MARRRATSNDLDRFLILRGGSYQYNRRVPLPVRTKDPRSPIVRLSLKTNDLALARVKRDYHEKCDNDLWTAYALGGDEESARKRYEAAVSRADILGFAYRSSFDLAAFGDTGDILNRIEAARSEPPVGPAAEAALGLVDKPKTNIKDAFKVYCDDIMSSELVAKSEVQKKDWRKVKQRAVDNFIALVGDKPISEITREDALKLHKWWSDQITAADTKNRRSASSGNRDLGNMRALFREYHKYMGDHTIQNPFDGLSFVEKVKNSRPPFSVKWITEKFLQPGGIQSLNIEARTIIFLMIETGARPSELCNLHRSVIRLDHNVPHIAVEPNIDPDDPREIKTASSVRLIPLSGIALEAIRKFPDGFPRYKNSQRTLSNTLNKTLKKNGLLETEKHSAYSLRHSFEDRMKNARFDEELRRGLMGHTINRPKYGEGGALEMKAEEISRIALPYDPVILQP